MLDALKSVAHKEESASVTVLTGHKAKGREWDTVRLHSDFEPKKFHRADPVKPIMNEEEARLLYVAATRPRLKLIAPSRLARFWGLAVEEAIEVSEQIISRRPPIVTAQPPKNASIKLPAAACVVTKPSSTMSASDQSESHAQKLQTTPQRPTLPSREMEKPSHSFWITCKSNIWRWF